MISTERLPAHSIGIMTPTRIMRSLVPKVNRKTWFGTGSFYSLCSRLCRIIVHNKMEICNNQPNQPIKMLGFSLSTMCFGLCHKTEDFRMLRDLHP